MSDIIDYQETFSSIIVKITMVQEIYEKYAHGSPGNRTGNIWDCPQLREMVKQNYPEYSPMRAYEAEVNEDRKLVTFPVKLYLKRNE